MSDAALLTGWGRTAPSLAAISRPATVEQVSDAVSSAGHRGVLPRGLGRSYGDAAQNGGGQVMDLTGLGKVLAFDGVAGLITVEAGLSLDALLRLVVPLGWFVAVTPGTRFVTVGGAIASDIHGKNHHLEGSFTRHVVSVDLVTGDGSVLTLLPGDEAFEATAGGMGLTGIVVRATLRLLPIETSRVLVDTEQIPDLDTLMERMLAGDDDYRYSVAWVDTLATGTALGRSVLTRGDHARLSELGGGSSPLAAAPLSYGPTVRLAAPPVVPNGLLNRLTVRAFNELWFRKASLAGRGMHRGLESIPAFFHPLDGVRGWNGLYGSHGFVQHQFVVPTERGDVVRSALERLSAARTPSFLAVLKRFGPAGPGPLSFPAPGWTLALDIPAAVPGLAALLDGLDELVAAAGGKVYLSKDARLRPDLLATMYPRLEDWRAVRDKLDPGGVFVSDLGRRLELCQ